MESYVVNTKSWHYWLCSKLITDFDDKILGQYGRRKPDFCSYWRMVTFCFVKLAWAAFCLLGASLLVMLLGGFAGDMLGIWNFNEPGTVGVLQAFAMGVASITTAVSIGFILYLLFCGALYVVKNTPKWINNYRVRKAGGEEAYRLLEREREIAEIEKLRNRKPSIIVARYKSWKGKYCLPVTVVENVN